MKKIALLGTILCFSHLLMAQWKPAPGPFGGTINTIKMMDGQKVLAGTYSGGVYASTDGGLHWKLSSAGIEEVNIRYFTRLGQYYYVGSEYNVYRSTNIEGPWTKVTPPGAGGFFCGVYALTATPDAIFFSSCNELYRSTDNGSTWQQPDTTGLPGTFFVVDVFDGVIYGGIYDLGIFSSADNGVTWTQIGANLPNKSIYSIKTTSQYVFAGTLGEGIYRSETGADNWTQVNTGLVGTTVYAIESKGDTLLAGTRYGVFMSLNNGDNWTKITSEQEWITSISTAGNTIVTGATYQGISLTANAGATWSISNEGLSNTLITGLAKRNDEIISSTFGAGVFSSADNGENWQALNLGLPSTSISKLMVHGPRVYNAIDQVGVFRLNEGDSVWSQVNTGLTNKDLRSLGSSNNRIFTGTYLKGLFRSDNNGTNWYSSSLGMTNQIVFSMAAEGNTVYAGTYNGVYRSENNGSTWTAANTGINTSKVSSLMIKNGEIFAGTEYDGIMHSVDSGATWVEVNNGLPSQDLGDVTSLISSGSDIYAAMRNVGVYVSGDNGASWKLINDGLPLASPTVLLIDGGFIYTGTRGNGVWRRPLSEVAGSNEAQQEVTLSAFYPNPATEEVMIDLPESMIGKTYTVTNTVGMQVNSGTIFNRLTKISVVGLPAGIYWLNIPEVNASGKFMKQ